MPPFAKKPKNNYYAVANGRDGPKIYRDWDTCTKAVTGWRKPAFKGFVTLNEAQDFLQSHGVPRDAEVVAPADRLIDTATEALLDNNDDATEATRTIPQAVTVTASRPNVKRKIVQNEDEEEKEQEKEDMNDQIQTQSQANGVASKRQKMTHAKIDIQPMINEPNTTTALATVSLPCISTYPEAQRKAIAVRRIAVYKQATDIHNLIFTDGSCVPNPGPCSLAVHSIMFTGQDKSNTSNQSNTSEIKQSLRTRTVGKALAVGSNNISELGAILTALRLLRNDLQQQQQQNQEQEQRTSERNNDPKISNRTQVIILTDSNYSVRELVKTNVPYENRNLILTARTLRNELQVSYGLQIHIAWVPSHCGIVDNDLVDSIANEARPMPCLPGAMSFNIDRKEYKEAK